MTPPVDGALASAAVCYSATAGHLFQTTVSAIQARRASPGEVHVVVMFMSRGEVDEAEAAVFEPVLAHRGIELRRVDRVLLGDSSPMFGRFHVDRVLPRHVDRLLYLDGDTQVVGELAPLLRIPLGSAGLAAVRDPMVVLDGLGGWQARRIRQWWDSASIPAATRSRYVNSGVMLVDRERLVELSALVRDRAAREPGLVFPDQDALNLVAGPTRLLSMAWNFPGFMLGTAAADVVQPRIIHFMSQPRPWQAVLSPWGPRHHAPYPELVAEEPATAPYWERLGWATLQRYRAQQAYKMVTERPRLRSARARAVVQRLESTVCG